MDTKIYGRRSFLKALGISGVGLFAGSFLFKTSPARALELCEKIDSKAPAAMMVNALKYVPVSKKAGQKCSNCIQYKQDATDKSIGQCTILQNCSVKSGGWCASWSKKG